MRSSLLAGRVALVTGGSRGIGAAICHLLAEQGAAVIVNYRSNHAAAQQVVAAITLAGGQAIAFAADVTDEQAVAGMVDQAVAHFGSVDILVNNAWPGWQGGAIEEVPWETYAWYMDHLVRAAYNTVRAVLPGMKRQRWGRIINIGTTSMYELNHHHTPYITAKGGLLALTRGLARDLGPHNICVNMVTPGLVWTREGEPPAGWGEPHVSRTALGRNPTAQDIAGAVTFLASPWADAITGVQLPVCGGLVMQVG
ncbi:MAG: beta-ketoacyl-ACP reductase [Pirellulaceae bacterium]|nr:MAG: beta-ketoacyl-ACP reductase [Pirellulaceae bacterium]